MSPFDGVEGEKNRKGSDDEAAESHEDEPGQVPTRTSRNVTDSAISSCSPRTSPGTKAGSGTSNPRPSTNTAYEITDLTHCHVPEGSSIVTATVRCSESSLSLNPIALYHKLLGGEGKVIRMTQLSPDSWMLLGYRYDGAPGTRTRESPTLLNADWRSSPLSDAVSHGAGHPDNGGDEKDENREEYRAHAAGGGQLSRGDMRSRKRTRVPWLESDDLRLLEYRKYMDMEWKDIVELFPDRTPGAVRTRWHMLRGNDFRTPKDDTSTEMDGGLGTSALEWPELNNSISSRDLLKTTLLSVRDDDDDDDDDDDGTLRDKWNCFLANTDSHKRHERGKKRKQLLEEEVPSSRASPKPSSKRVRTSAGQFRRRSARLRLRSGGSCGKK